ncbi:MAG: hypothetical protein K1X57_21155, partial [Gemmataceae bacterium]|nr:hypothetical protein [Gemmataceae bacterium]
MTDLNSRAGFKLDPLHTRSYDFCRGLWPPLPVWRRLDAGVLVVAAYTAIVVATPYSVGVPEWSGCSTIINALILGLLLGFRNKESYDRWWEGRKLWGTLINDARSLCTKVMTVAGLSPDTRALLVRHVVGFGYALRDSLRDEDTLQRVPGFEKSADDPKHVPLYLYERIIAVLQAERSAGRLSEIDLLLFDPHVRSLMDVCGACERIKNTPVPLSYRSLLRHGIVLYLVSAPWFVAQHLSWW